MGSCFSRATPEPPQPRPAECHARRRGVASRPRLTEEVSSQIPQGDGDCQAERVGVICRTGLVGTVANLASRLCGKTAADRILFSRRLLGLVEDLVEAEPLGDLTLKGFTRPVPTFNVRTLRQG